MQHALVELEESLLKRAGSSVTSRAAYAGGHGTGAEGIVCYHNAGDVADYGKMGYAEVVSLTVPESSFAQVAQKFWELCPRGQREDAQDTGGEYRSVVGLPGGMHSPLLDTLRGDAGSALLTHGAGSDADTLDTGKVYVYDTRDFPPHVAEKYHQFHDDMMAHYGTAYAKLKDFARKTQCPGDQASVGFLQMRL